jgi:hypothetical protein
MHPSDLQAMLAHERRRGAALRVEADENGAVRVISLDAARASRKHVGAQPYKSERQLVAWLADPRCAHCGEVIEDVEDCATVPSEIPGHPLRVAHKPNATPTSQHCFVQAVLVANPTFNTRRARERAGA